MDSRTRDELQDFIQRTFASLNSGDNYLAITNALIVIRGNIRDGGKSISLLEAESRGISPFEANGELKSTLPDNLTYEMRTVNLSAYGINIKNLNRH